MTTALDHASGGVPDGVPGTENPAPARRGRLGNDLYNGHRSFPFVQKRRVWFAIAGTLALLSLLALLIFRINPGIEFRGGSEFMVSGVATTAEQPALDVLSSVDATQVPRVSRVGQDSVRVQTEELSNDATEQVRQGLAQAYGTDVSAVTSTYIGPTWGADVSQKAITSLVIFLVLVTVVMAVYFRTWKMAAGGIVALLHDVLLTVGVYSVVGFEVTPATVIGFLTILGYSLYDTVVVFDKVRENTEGILDQDLRTYEEAANLAVNQTLVRSVHTSVTGLLPVGSILVVGVVFLGAGSLRDIALALFVGMLLSTVSSVFIATPVEVALKAREPAVRAHTEKVLAKRAARRRAELGEDATDYATGDATGDAAGDAGPAVDLRARPDELHPDATPGRHLGAGAQPRRLPKGKR